MRIAIIEKNKKDYKNIKKSINNSYKEGKGVGYHWNIDFYIDPEKFLKKAKEQYKYDIVLIDCDLGDQICFDFIDRVSDNTDAELCVMTGNGDPRVLENFVADEKINYILNKRDLVAIVEHLEYASTKIKIKEHLMNESTIYAAIANEMF